MQLQELTPKRSKFTLKCTQKDYWLRPFSLEDEAWFRGEFGGKNVNKLVIDSGTIDIAQLCRLAWNQLEDQSAFLKKDIIVVLEDGTEDKRTLGGVKLLRTMIVGGEDKMSILNAINECMTGNRPDPSEEDPEDPKKKAP